MSNTVKVTTGGGALSQDHSGIGINISLTHEEGSTAAFDSRVTALFAALAEAECTSGQDLTVLKQVAEPIRSAEAKAQPKEWWSATLTSVGAVAAAVGPSIKPFIEVLASLKSVVGL